MPLDVERVNERLPERLLFWMDETDSTMLDAARLAAGGCPTGTVVGADSQSAGQGRHGHSWFSEKDNGLYFSVVLWTPLAPEDQPVVTLAAGLAVAEAITQVTGLAADLRWPNDVMIGERKVCGILIQQHHQALVAGIGLNVNHAAFPEDIAGAATSLRLAAGRVVSREDLLMAVLQALDRHVEVLVEQGKDAILRLFSRASSYASGRRVVVDQGGVQSRGVTAGLDENGFLVLRKDDGTRTLILAGGVRPE
jgi:BirA family biotin operon repressor/biotin-[acetyl-CoA-carboxylase] ligase